MKRKVLGLVHTSATLVPVFQQLCKAILPDVDVFNIADDSLIKDVIARNHLSAPLFVGDTAGDQAAAAACNVAFIHASYGFGACPDARLRVASFAELVELLLGSTPTDRERPD